MKFIDKHREWVVIYSLHSSYTESAIVYSRRRTRKRARMDLNELKKLGFKLSRIAKMKEQNVRGS
jgi:hypothetical protein